MAQRTRRQEAPRPAPFTPEQVADLIGGNADQNAIGKLLLAHRQPRIPGPPKGALSKRPAPIPLATEQLRDLAAGSAPPAIGKLLETGAAQRRRSTGRVRRSGAKPKQRPPLY